MDSSPSKLTAPEPQPDNINLEQTAALLESQGDIANHAERYGGDWRNCPFLGSMGEAGVMLVEQWEQAQQDAPQEKTVAELLAERRRAKDEAATEVASPAEPEVVAAAIPPVETYMEAATPQPFELIQAIKADPPIEVILAEQETVLQIAHDPFETEEPAAVRVVVSQEDTWQAEVTPVIAAETPSISTIEVQPIEDNEPIPLPIEWEPPTAAGGNDVAELFIAPIVEVDKVLDTGPTLDASQIRFPTITEVSIDSSAETRNKPSLAEVSEIEVEATDSTQTIETWVNQLLVEITPPTQPELPNLVDLSPLPALPPEAKAKVVETVETIATCLQTIVAESSAPEQVQAVTEQLESLVSQLFEDLGLDTNQEVIKMIVQDMINSTRAEWIDAAQELIASPVDSNGTYERKLPNMRSLQARLGQAFRQKLDRLRQLSRYIMSWLTPEASWVALQLRAAS